MGTTLRLPNITGPTERERLSQMQSYLFQLVEELNWALQNVDTSNDTVVNPTPRSLMPSVGGSYGVMPVGDDPQSTFNAIKSLIIKSADIVEAYYEEISKRLEGVYVAESDFGTYKQETSQDIVESSTNLNRVFNNVQEIKTGVDSSLEKLSEEVGKVDAKAVETAKALGEDIKKINDGLKSITSTLVEVTANINSGILYTDVNGVPVYGIEVGQRTTIDGVEVFNKFARFIADRLSFYDRNGIEVAYISDRRLYIYNVEVTGIFKMGGLVSTVLPNGDVVEKWVGRS